MTNRSIFFLFFSQILILHVSFINIFPDGYIFLGGDVIQYVAQGRILEVLRYMWNDMTVGEGTVTMHYPHFPLMFIFFKFVDFINLTPSQHSFLYYFLFLTASFWSFYCSSGYFFSTNEPRHGHHRIFFALLYTFNLYTFKLYYYVWGFTLFSILYILIPPLFGLIYQYLIKDKNQFFSLSIGLLAIVMLALNFPAANFPFLVATGLLVAVFILIIMILWRNEIDSFSTFLCKFTLIWVLFFLGTAWSFIPQAFELIGGLFYSASMHEEVFNLKQWVVWQAVKFPDIFFMTSNIADFKTIYPLAILSITPIFALLFFLIAGSNRKLMMLFTLMLIVLIVLTNKFVGILSDSLIGYIFTSNPILGALRSNDKTLIFFPFMIVMVISLGCKMSKKSHLIVLCLMMFTNAISIYPMFTGKIQQNHSLLLKKGQNITQSEYSFLIKIPNEYIDIAKKMNEEPLEFRYLDLPYSVLNSPGWINFPKWKAVGHNPIIQFFKHPIIHLNSFFFSGIGNYGPVWNEQTCEESLWIFTLAQYYNIRYFIYHLDVHPHFIKISHQKLDCYESKGLIEPIEKNDMFILYKISDSIFHPKFYAADNVLFASKENLFDQLKIAYLEQIQTKINKMVLFTDFTNVCKRLINRERETFQSKPIIEFRKITPIKYRVIIHNIKKPIPLVFSERYHRSWRMYPVPLGINQKMKITNQFGTISSNIFKDNRHDLEASSNDISIYLEKDFISNIGQGITSQTFGNDTYASTRPPLDINNLNIDFISKLLCGTIQNNNLPSGDYYETWFEKSMDDKYHLKANACLNSWIVDPDHIVENFPYAIKKNQDGTYDIELVIEFWNQRILYLGLFVSFALLVVILSYFLFILSRSICSKFCQRGKHPRLNSSNLG